MLWFMQGLCALPVFLVIWSSCTFIVSYLVALFRHDIDVIFPYISDTGAQPPESCIFGFMAVVSSYAGIGTIYARYKFVEKLSEETRAVSPLLNKWALVLGWLSCLGMCIVATFQETAQIEVHDTGALLFFITGVSYTILQSIISFHAFPYGSSICVCRVRLCIAIIAALALLPTVICAVIYALSVKNQSSLHIDERDKIWQHLSPSLQNYAFHVTSAACEWVVAFSFVCFFLTYIDDFKLFTLRVKTEYEQ